MRGRVKHWNADKSFLAFWNAARRTTGGDGSIYETNGSSRVSYIRGIHPGLLKRVRQAYRHIGATQVQGGGGISLAACGF